MITFEQYKLTSVIKVWIADCKSKKMKKMLLRKLYYLYCDQNSIPENELVLMNTKNSFLSDELQITRSDVSDYAENDKDVDANVNKNNDQLSHANELRIERVCQVISKQTKRKSAHEFTDIVRNHIQYYEARSSNRNLNVNTDKTRSTKILNSPEVQCIITRPPPVVVGMILKAKVDDETESELTMPRERLQIERSLVTHDNTCSISKFNSSTLSNKDKGNERFIINLFEPRTSKHNVVVDKKIPNKSLISMSSELLIKDLSMECNSENTSQDYNKTSSNEPTNDSFSTSLEIMKKIYNQRQIIKQAVKAVRFCRKSNYFYNSIQRAEAERILLTASLKRDHLLVELQNAHKEEFNQCTADLIISNIKFPFNFDEITGTRRVWFLITCATESTFHISRMFELTSKNSCLKIPDMYTFENVPPNFVIKLCVYELTISEGHEKKKIQLSQKFKKKVLRNRSNSITDEKIAPSFRICGWVDLTLDNFKNNVINLNKNTTKSSFSEVHFSGSAFSLVLNKKWSSFVTVGFEINGYLVWDKYWCKLSNSVLYFWSNPSEENFNDSKTFIDLRNFVLGSTENMCVRSNTLVLESVIDNLTTRRYYLSCDTLEDFNSCTCYIKSILDTFRHWKSLMYV
ncbi:hypothetical protein FQR65_LT12083 [Abscondita terminalis]|nr:hypothetical protein FQR65_LT12083 [Abscondita terminalis]